MITFSRRTRSFVFARTEARTGRETTWSGLTAAELLSVIRDQAKTVGRETGWTFVVTLRGEQISSRRSAQGSIVDPAFLAALESVVEDGGVGVAA